VPKVADSSGNGAAKNRFWGGTLAGKSSSEVDACAPGEPCNNPCARSACNVGEVYAIECPARCLKEQLGGDVFGAGTGMQFSKVQCVVVLHGKLYWGTYF
jgi:hypothetical protein